MIDPSTLASLASATVALLAPLVGKAFEKGAEEAGKGSAALLVERLKTRLASTRAKDALHDMAQQPQDADTQATLRVQLKKAVEAEPALADFLQQWLADSRLQAAALGIGQTATVTGDHNTTVQIAGTGNTVGW